MLRWTSETLSQTRGGRTLDIVLVCTETVECALPHNMCIPHTHAGEGGGDIKNIHSDTWWSWPAESHSKISHAYNLNDHEQDIGEGPQRLYGRSRGLEIINAITQKAWDDSWVSAEVHQPPERWFQWLPEMGVKSDKRPTDCAFSPAGSRTQSNVILVLTCLWGK